jgi:tetratricopeptide (TPR) repeat protein
MSIADRMGQNDSLTEEGLAQIPPYPDELIVAAFNELLVGDLNLSHHLWRILLDYQKRLLTASIKRFEREALRQLHVRHRDSADARVRWDAGLLCLDNLLRACLLNLCNTYTQLSKLYHHIGEVEKAGHYLSQRDMLQLLIRPVAANDTSDFRSFGLPSVWQNIKSGSAQTRAEEIAFTNITPITAYSPLMTESDGASASPSFDLSAGSYTSSFTLESEIDLPAHRLELITRIVNELLIGDIGLATRLWAELVNYQHGLTFSCINRLDENFVTSLTRVKERATDDLILRRDEVFTRLDDIAKFYISGLRRLYLKLAQLYIRFNRVEIAYACVNELFSLYDITGYVETTDGSLIALLNLMSQAEDGGTPLKHISVDSAKGAEALAILRKLTGSSDWVARSEVLLESIPFNATACKSFCEEISAEFLNAQQYIQVEMKHPLITVHRNMQKKRAILHDAAERLELSWGMFYLNRALRKRIKYNDPEEQFHDYYEFHNTVRSHPQITDDPEIFRELQAAVRDARIIACELLESPEFTEKVERQSRFSNFFYSRLGEICRAHRQYKCVSDPELTTVLELGVDSFKYSLLTTDQLDSKRLGFLYPRLAECLYHLGHYAEAIDNYIKVIELRDSKPALKWEAHKFIAKCFESIANDIRNKDVNIDVSHYYSEAESSLVEASKVWEPRANICQEKCKDIRNSALHYHLTTVYLNWGKYIQAERQARIALDWVNESFNMPAYNNYRNLVTYLLGEALAKQERNEEAIDVLDKLLKTNVDPRYKARSLLLLKKLYALEGNREGVRATTTQLVKTGREIGNKNFVPLTSTQEMMFLDEAEMSAYIAWCNGLLNKGRVRTLIEELPSLVAVSQSLWPSHQPDPLLLILLASAYMEIGHYDAAIVNIKKAMNADQSSRNIGICWLKMGEVFMRQEAFQKAAEAFQNSYSLGGESLGPLLMAAKACSRARDYDTALQHLEMIGNSGRDSSPFKTNTELARTLWFRYCDPQPGVGGNDQDVVAACEYLKSILLGKFGKVGDPYAAFQLASMSDHHEARNLIIQLLKIAPFTVQLRLINKLMLLGLYDEEFTYAAISVLPRDSDLNNVSRRVPAQRAVSKYIMGAWVYAYLNRERHQVTRYIRQTIRLMWQRTQDPEFWAGLLAGHKDAMSTYVRGQWSERLSAILINYPTREPQEFIHYLSHKALPTLYFHLRTQLLGLVSTAYRGREPTCALIDELVEAIEFWLINDTFKMRDKISPEISMDGMWQSYHVTPFQREIAVSFFNQLVEQISYVVPSHEQLNKIAMRVETAGQCYLVKMLIRLAPEQSQAQYEEFCRKLLAVPFLREWKVATSSLLPQPITVKLRLARKDIVITLPLWRSPALERDDWPWNEFYSFVVENSSSMPKDSDYYATAKDLLPELLLTGINGLPIYVLAQLDGLFVQAYKASGSALAVPHTIKNNLRNLIDTQVSDVMQLGELAVQIKRLNKIILEVGPILKREFDIQNTLRDIISECHVFYPDVVFEFQAVRSMETIIFGSKGHIIAAIWDVIHNSVDGVRRAPEESPRRIKFSVVLLNDGVEVIIANTGLPSLDPSVRGFGIGTQSVEDIICTLHGGRVSHGPIHVEELFQYQWQLFIPLQSINEWRRE